MLTQPILNSRHSDRNFWFSGVANDQFATSLERQDRTLSHARLILVELQEPSVAERLRAEVAQFKRLTSKFSMHLDDEVRRRLVAQFAMLLDADDWDEAEPLPSMSSQLTLLRAVTFLRPRVRPSLGLAGPNLLAMWGDKSTALTLEFQAEDRVRWFMRIEGADQVDTAAGTASVLSLPNILKGVGVAGALDGAQ